MRHFRLPEMLQTAPASGRGLATALQRTTPRLRLVLSALAVAGLVAVVWYFTAGPSGPSMPDRLAPPVNVARAVQKQVTIRARTIGTVVANATVNVSSRVDGQVIAADFKEGQIVHQGEVLFRLDPRPFQAALDQAQANLARDQAQLSAALRNRRRYDALAKDGAISAQQHEQVTAQAGALAGTARADAAAIAMAKLNLGYAVIRSPFEGKTGPIQIQPGNLVKANDPNPLVVVTQIQPIKVSFFLPQTDLPRIQAQMRARKLVALVTVHGDFGSQLTAPVDFVGNAVSAQTGTIELRASFPNKDARLVPGELVDVAVGLDELRDATVVPDTAVNVGPNGRYVYVVDAQNLARMESVSVLYDDGTNSAVKGKIHGGDIVITVGQLRVEPGHPVSIENGGQGAKGADSGRQ